MRLQGTLRGRLMISSLWTEFTNISLSPPRVVPLGVTGTGLCHMIRALESAEQLTHFQSTAYVLP